MKIRQNVPLSDILFYKIGGKTRWLLEAQSPEDVIEAIEFIQTNKIDQYMVVGLGANLLMPDEDYNGVVIRIKSPGVNDIRMTHDGIVVAFAGNTLDELIHYSFKHTLLGLEVLGGLPSTVGGAIRGNAGAFGIEMKDVIEKVSVLEVTDSGYEMREFTREECQFSYRNSLFKQNPQFIILKGLFQFNHGTDEEIEKAKTEYQKQIDYRKARHPVEYPSCGSVFQNIRDEKEVEKMLQVWPDMKEQVHSKWHGKVSMGYVINRLGLQGIQVGGAKITDKHANYISNIKNAKASDVREIIDTIREKFFQTFGFYPDLEAEVVI